MPSHTEVWPVLWTADVETRANVIAYTRETSPNWTAQGRGRHYQLFQTNGAQAGHKCHTAACSVLVAISFACPYAVAVWWGRWLPRTGNHQPRPVDKWSHVENGGQLYTSQGVILPLESGEFGDCWSLSSASLPRPVTMCSGFQHAALPLLHWWPPSDGSQH